MVRFPSSDEEVLDAYSHAVTSVVDAVGPAVVSVPLPRGGGSGVLFPPDGYLLTNAHVVGRASSVKIALPDGSTHDGNVVGADPATDLAVVHIGGAHLPSAELGTSSKLRVGQLVVAIGNPLGFSFTVSAGVVSALGLAQKTGVELLEVVPEKPAARAGLHFGDILLSLDGSTVHSIDEVHRLLGASSIGRPMPCKVLRGASLVDVTVTPGE